MLDEIYYFLCYVISIFRIDIIKGILLNNQYKIITLDFDERIQRNILIEEARKIGNNFGLHDNC